MTGSNHPTLPYLLGWALPLLVLLATFAAVWSHPDSTQPDFRVYYSAARAHSLGLNPYDLHDLSHSADRELHIGFVYPPLTLWLFRPFLLLPYDQACRLWLIIKLLAGVALFLIWRRAILPDVAGPLLLVAATFAFNAALLWDLRSGNISVLEQLLLWSAFVFYMRARLLPFILLLLPVALFKLQPAAFLILLLMPYPTGRRFWLLAGAVAGLSLAVCLPLVSRPDLAKGFLHSVLADRPTGEINPSLLGLVDGLSAAFRLPSWCGLLAWLGCGIVLGTVSKPFVRTLVSVGNRRLEIAALTILYALLVPRMMAYSYLLVVPALFILGMPLVSAWRAQALVLLLVCWQGIRLIPPLSLGSAIDANASYLFLLCFWCYALVRFRRDPGLFRPVSAR